jgi:hypothetical protein
MNRKAVLYSHFGGLNKYKDDASELAKSNYVKRFEEMIGVNLESLTEINDYILPAVYVFIDIGTYAMIKQKKGIISDSGVDHALIQEKNVISELEKIEKQARQNIADEKKPLLSEKDAIDNYPKFIYIGINELGSLLDELESVKPELPKYLGGRDGNKFTYDTPKFVEAGIRIESNVLNREELILRIDEDVTIYYKGIKTLMDSYPQVMENPFHYFSGSYGIYDKKENPGDEKPGDDHPKNNYAVRVHFFIDPKTQTPDPALDFFLADLTELGAVQKIPAGDYSSKLKELISQGKHKEARARKTPEIISGAGLAASHAVLRHLPPFMCFDMNVTWIDDHLKRRLLEVLEFVSPDDTESVQDAKFRKNRHTGNITPENIAGSGGYLEVLLSGFMFHSLISDDNQQATVYSQAINEIIRSKSKKLSWYAKYALRKGIKRILEEKYEKVLKCWTSLEYANKPAPLDTFYNWSKIEKETKANKDKLVNGLTEDALRYLELVAVWDNFVRAFEGLGLLLNKR